MDARTILLAFTALVLAGCAQKNATISERRPVFHPASTGVGTVVSAQKSIADASRQEQREPLAALGAYLTATQDAARELQRNPRDMAARDAYNFALGRVLETIKEAKLDPWTQPLRVPAAGGEFTLTHKPDPRPQWNPALYDFTPADQFDIKGSYVTEHTRKDGVGAPLVAKGLTNNANSRENFYLPRTYYGVTAVARFEGRRCVIGFEDPLATETIMLDGHTFPLAADFTVPLAVLLAETDYHKLELARMLDPQKYAGTARIARLQPYYPNKTVVLVIHGLQDSAATWTPMINDLRGDERIRRNYQFWFYSYPSGYPYPYSASILRQQLDAVERKFPLHKPMVVISTVWAAALLGCSSPIRAIGFGWIFLGSHRPKCRSHPKPKSFTRMRSFSGHGPGSIAHAVRIDHIHFQIDADRGGPLARDDLPRFQLDRAAKRHCQRHLDRLGSVRGWRHFPDFGAGSPVQRNHANLQRTDQDCVGSAWEIRTMGSCYSTPNRRRR
jgi:hypothetical protein